MRNPHRMLRVVIWLFTPIGWGMVIGYQVAQLVRDALRKGNR